MISSWNETAKCWNTIWFTPRAPEALSETRIATGILAAVHFIALLIQGTEWIGPHGWLNVDAGRYLIGDAVEGTGGFYRWSILYWFPNAVQIVAAIGLFASITTMAGIGARLSPFLAWFCLSTFHQRAPTLTMIHEPLIVSLMAYLTIDPGRLSWTVHPGLASGQARIGVNVVLQLIRCHLWIWIAFSLTSMLANTIWWNGEAGWYLIQQSRGWLHLAKGCQWLGQVLTHLVIATQAALLFCMIHYACDRLGKWSLYLFLLTVLLLIGDWMYASVLFAASLAVWPVPLSQRTFLSKPT